MMTNNLQGESVRGFQVIVTAPANRVFTLGKTQFRLPPDGYPLYTGERALEVMRGYAGRRPGVRTEAFTTAEHSGDEVCTLEEMEALYGDEVPA